MFFKVIMLLFSFNLFAGSYPARTNTRITFLDDDKEDFSLRINAINHAKKSIDIISFSQALDDIGNPFIQAIRNKIVNNCIKVRFIYDSFASLVDRDFFNRSAQALTSNDLKCKAEVISLGIRDKQNHGLSIDDFMHEKVLIIDFGTPDEKIFLGGRGYTHFSSIVIDSALLIEPINQALPSLGSDIQESFEELWKIAKSITLPFTNDSNFNFNQDHKLPFQKLVNENKTFIPRSTQLFSNDLLKNLLKKNNNDINQREQFINPNVLELKRSFSTFNGTIEIFSYAVAFPFELKKALIDFVNRGNILNLYTNSLESHQLFFPLGVPVFYSIENISDLLISKKNNRGQINIYFLKPDLAINHHHHGYLHSKMILLKNVTEKIIYTGSDNFTWSSTYKNDEWLIKIIDDSLFDEIEKKNQITKISYQKISDTEIKKLNDNKSFFYYIFKPFIKDNY